MLSALISKIGLPILIAILVEALGSVDNPVSKKAAKALGQVDEAIQAGQINPRQIEDANRHAEKMAEIKLKENEKILAEVNKTLRAELASEDKYIRRMRPTFGYLVGLTWAAQMFGLAYVIIFQTAQAGAVLQGMSSLSAIWGVGLSVLGVYVYKRSEEKKGAGPETIFWNKLKN